VALADGDGAAAAEQDTAQASPLSLKARLAAITADCDDIQKSNIQKEKDGKKWTERGHIVEAILAEWRPLLTKHGVVMTPNLVDRAYTGNRCDVTVDFRFERTDESTEERVVRWAGCGTDNGDKAFAKAGTNALKEMIKKTFLVTDRDDAKEETETVEHETPETIAAKAGNLNNEKRRDAVAAWAKTFKFSLENAKTLPDLQRVERENRDQLSSPDLADVTRTFFIELIEERKAAFK
jgi:hypothetical protein